MWQTIANTRKFFPTSYSKAMLKDFMMYFLKSESRKYAVVSLIKIR